MSRSPIDVDQWQEEYLHASARDAHQLVLALLEQPLSPELIDELDLGMILVELRDELVGTNDFAAILHFFDAIRDRHPALYASEYPYFDTFLVDYYLYRSERAPLQQALSHFRANPILGVDQLFEVLEALCLYGENTIASDLCRATYDPIRKSPDVIRGAEEELNRIPFYARLEVAYRTHQSGETVDWETLQADLKQFGRSDQSLAFADLQHGLTTSLPPADALSAEFQTDLARFLRRLLIASCRHLAVEKQMSFLTVKVLWDGLVEFLERRDVPPSQLQSPDAFFRFSEDELDRHLSALVNAILSQRSTAAVGLLWGIPYLYDYLQMVGIVTAATHQAAIAAATNLKSVLCQFFEQSLWRFDFVHRWQPPDSTSAEVFQAEAEQFRATFAQRYPLSNEPVIERNEQQFTEFAEALDRSFPTPLAAAPLAERPAMVPDPPPPAPYKVPKKKKSPLKLAAELGARKNKKRR